jgi:hypothetical protein
MILQEKRMTYKIIQAETIVALEEMILKTDNGDEIWRLWGSPFVFDGKICQAVYRDLEEEAEEARKRQSQQAAIKAARRLRNWAGGKTERIENKSGDPSTHFSRPDRRKEPR